MTLTLEQVRQTRFHLARRNGYEPVDVDNFVDKVEATLSQLSEENDTLKQQVEALSSSEPSSIFVPGDTGESDQLRGELSGLQSEIERLRQEVQAKQGEIDQLRGELQGSQNDLNSARGEIQQLRAPEPTDTPKGQVENIVVTSSADASPAVTRLLQMATEQAERLVGESQIEAERLVTTARGEAESIIDSANRKSHETLTDARTRAERVESEARVNAERVTSDAQNKAASVTHEADQRRAELFTALESERDQLRDKVDHLRSFETNFRSNLTGHLEGQIRSLQEAKFTPEDEPALLTEPGRESATPRLDALLGDQG